MKKYKLVDKTYNTYDQISTRTIQGEDIDADSFLERCFQMLEMGKDDPGLTETVEQPDNFGNAGGFAEMPNETVFTEDDIDITETRRNFAW